MFLTLKNEKTLKKMRSKTLKNNIFFILGRNLIIRSFEIPHSIWKLHKDFKSVFVFKFRQKTKKFTPKWQKPLFEKRVIINWQKIYLFVTHFIISISIERFLQTLCKSTTISQSHLSQRFIERNLLKEMMESEIWLNCCFFRVYQHFFISVGKCPREWIIASLQICIWPNQARIVLLTAYWNSRKEG